MSVSHTWYNQNEDHRELNDVSKVTLEDGRAELESNEESAEYEYEGTPVVNAEKLKEYEQWPLAHDDKRYAAELLKECFGVTLKD